MQTHTHRGCCLDTKETLWCTLLNKQQQYTCEGICVCVHIGQHTCTCICICGCVHICIHMHACWSRWWWCGGGGVWLRGQASLWIKAKVRAAAVAHVQGEWRPQMALHYQAAPSLLHPIGHPPPTFTIIALAPTTLLPPQGPVLKMPVHWDPFCSVYNPTQHMQTHACSHTGGCALSRNTHTPSQKSQY